MLIDGYKSIMLLGVNEKHGILNLARNANAAALKDNKQDEKKEEEKIVKNNHGNFLVFFI